MRLLRISWLWALLLALSACGSSSPGPSSDGGTQSPDSGTGIGSVSGQALLEGTSVHGDVTISLEGTSLTATTDAQGRFTLANVNSGGYTVVARRSGYAEARRAVAVLAGETAFVTLNLARSPGGILGTVRVEGVLDASGVNVTLVETGATTTTDALGQFLFSNLAPGPYNVALQKTDYLSTRQSVSVQSGGSTLVNIDLTRERGRVVGTALLEGASNHMGTSLTLVEAGVSATADADGRFVFENVMTGTYTVRARREFYVDTQGSVTVRASVDNPVTLSLALVRGDVAGTVQLGDGATPSGVTVTVMETSATATSDAQGRFSFTRLPLGTYTLAARKEGYVDAQQAVQVRAGAAASVAFSLTRSQGRVEGTALLEGASDHFGTTVVILETNVTTTTDAQGRFGFNVTSGTYTVEARRAGYGSARQTVQVPENQTGTVSLTLARERGGVAGVILLEGGSSPVDITVTLVGTTFTARTNSSGQFSFSAVPTGSYTLEASKEHFSTARQAVTVRVNEQAQVNATLAIGRGNITGVVLLEDAPSVSGISVALVQNSAMTSTDSQGRFAFNNLTTGTYSLSAWWHGYEIEERSVVVRADETTSLNITLRRAGGAVSGVILLEGESDHSGISVSLAGHDGVATTNAQGRFVLEGVSGGHHMLTARKDDFATWEMGLKVETGEAAAVSLSLARLGR